MASDGASRSAPSASIGTAATPGDCRALGWDKKVPTLPGALRGAGRAERHPTRSALRAAQEQRAAAETFAAVGDIAANLLHQLNNKVGTIPVRVEGIQDK